MAMRGAVRARAHLAVAAVFGTGGVLYGCGGKDFAVPLHDGGADGTVSALTRRDVPRSRTIRAGRRS
jgi:hypothetical protein